MKTLLGTIGSAACIVALALATSTTQAQNMLVDPGFELNLTTPNPITPATVGQGWALFGGVYSTAKPESGTQSLQIYGNNGWSGVGAYQVLGGVSGGQQYTLTADFNTDGVGGQFLPNPAILQINYLNSLFASIGTVENPGNGYGGLQTGTPPFDNTGNGPWSVGTITATAPAGAAYIVTYLMDVSGPASDLFFDNASLTVVPEPSTLALLGLGLASAMIWRRRQ
jgi:hypothetical protein